MKIGLVGTGGFSRLHAGLLEKMKDVEISAICGRSTRKAEEMAAGFGAKGYGALKSMLEAESLDAVYICVPPMVHGVIEEELIQRGIPFFVEKPLGVDDELPNHICELVEERSLITSVGYHFRYLESVEKMKDLLRGSKIGMVTANWSGSMPEVKWWRDNNQSGGQFVEQTTHLVDLLRFLCGEIDEIHAFFGEGHLKNVYENVTVPDVGSVNMKLKNGAVANFSNTCILPAGTGDVRMVFYTEKGILEWSPKQLKCIEAGRDTIYRFHDNPYLKESEIFLDAVRHGKDNGILSPYQDAVKTQQITHAATVSARDRFSVKL
ncbi:Gfo/Idh/MocA family protein [Sediminibacillus massiliensis]|uniref:Gfo/Idh/MocA family protein n=1 Tax=Sediminibacillus massiliensis TaxID=1926277 RepID=UPI00098887F9|nr:Gfo/Idh/MocA family oxidoreductase [Sediminibacillus massiliensis]